MEESYFGSGHASLGWQNSDKTAAAAALQANCAAAGQLQPFLTLNWNQHQQPDQSSGPGMAHFQQSPLTSSGQSPAPHHLLPPAAAASLVNDSVAFRELLGRLTSGGGEISQWASNFTNNAACFSPPHSFAPPTLPHPNHHPTLTSAVATTQLSSLVVDPGFVERAARFSSFCGGLPGQFPLPELSTVHTISPILRPGGGGGSQQLGVADNNEISVLSRSSTPEDAEFRGVRDDSPSGSDQKFKHSNSKKRKADASLAPAVSRIPLKAVAEEDVIAKRMKTTDTFGNGKEDLNPKVEGSGGANSGGGGDGGRKQGKENNSNSKTGEAPKDYIHVRARRGQATDSHSLAERVRREKISQRMKFLQDLVPGCNKVTGKAVMLDEIINYVQSLQRQVEFLSMKLATVNPQLDFNASSLQLQKDQMYQPRGPPPNTVFQMESSSSLPFPFAQPPPASQDAHHMQNNNNVGSSGGIDSHLLNPMDSTLKQRPLNGSVLLPALDGFGGASSRVGGSFMEDDLHSVVQMGLGQSQEDSFSSRPFEGK